MKLAKRSKKFAQKTTYSVSSMMGIRVISGGATYITNLFRRFCTLPKKEPDETFEQAAARFHLSEEDLIIKIRHFVYQMCIFFITGIVLFIYGLYVFAQPTSGRSFTIFLAAIMMFCYGFRAHFWVFQIKNRKLGCTFREWFSGYVKEQEKKE